MVYQPSAHPGCVAPHLWLADGSSLYDRFGPDFTLLVTADGHDADAEAFAAAAARAGLPLRITRPGDGRLAARYEAPLALIRPDQHVAWRGRAAPADLPGLLDTVRGARVPAMA